MLLRAHHPLRRCTVRTLYRPGGGGVTGGPRRLSVPRRLGFLCGSCWAPVIRVPRRWIGCRVKVGGLGSPVDPGAHDDIDPIKPIQFSERADMTSNRIGLRICGQRATEILLLCTVLFMGQIGRELMYGTYCTSTCLY